MIAAIMQPYVFPYIGYFQLIARCDVFVFHDDVQYIKGGWINRNRILINGSAHWITLPVYQGAHDQAINMRRYCLERTIVDRLLRRIEAAYRKAPRFAEVFALIRGIMEFGDANVAAFNAHSVQSVAAHLGLLPCFLLSSALQKDNRLAGQERVIEICRCIGATRYVNPVGGVQLYRQERFTQDRIALDFLEPVLPLPLLSIIDVLMKYEPAAIAVMLRQCRLLREEARP